MIYQIVIDELLVLMLLIDASWVAYGLYKKRVMWKYIVLYWVILSAKNLWNYISLKTA